MAPETNEAYTLLGTGFQVLCTSSDVARHPGRLLHALRGAGGPVPRSRTFTLVSADHRGDGSHCLYRDGELLLTSQQWGLLECGLCSDLNAEALAASDHFAMHSGAVAGGQGVLAFPAPSGAGKSTLTAACVAAGFAYVSDEALCVDYDTGSIVAYPKPLALSRWSREALGIEGGDGDDEDELMVPPGDLGTVVGDEELHLSDVVLMSRRPGPPVLDEVPRSESMAALLGMSFNHYKHPEQAVRLAAALANGSRAWRLGYDHPLPAADLLAHRLG